MVILLDEVDNVLIDLKIGSFIKNLLESLVVQNCTNIMFILSGLPKVRDILKQSHESSIRIFEEMHLNPLENKDITHIYKLGIEFINEKIKPKELTIEEGALKRMTRASEGYPHFAQQIGASVFNVNTDLNIIDEDVKAGIFNKGGAIDLIGDRFYYDLYFNKIKEESYREILQIMAENPKEWITKKEIKTKFRKKDTTLRNGLQALRQRNIIISKAGTRGYYKLQWIGFGIWIKYYSQNRTQQNF